MVNQFRTDLSGVNNGVGGSFMTGRREINWDGVPDNFAEPNPLPFNFFNVNSPRGVDVVALDDFIYGEPRAMTFHAGDFDGDGFSDASVFRPSAGTFFVLNSGSNTVSFIPFGINGDIPVAGDFDGDQRADVAIFRPSVGQWWLLKSSDGSNFSTTFGQNGDKPAPGDYDKDGKTDIAVWRPSNGTYFIARSSANFSSFFTAQWGLNGDLPVGAAIAP